MSQSLPISVVIPTYRREHVLLETVRHLLALAPAEILVIDQTESHEAATDAQLAEWDSKDAIRWMRLSQPSVTAAMNTGLLASTQPLVAYMDDDIVPEPGLLAAHVRAQGDHPGALVAGRVLQPWDEGRDHSADKHFHFASTRPNWIHEFIGCNFSVHREAALAVGGFDENFVRVAYRFEAEFAHRWLAAGKRIYFAPEACIHHLKAGDGGTRSFGHHLTTWRSDHAVGAYYWALRTRTWREFILRPAGAITTRFHFRHPWRIPASLIAELGGMLWALKLHLAGPRHIAQDMSET